MVFSNPWGRDFSSVKGFFSAFFLECLLDLSQFKELPSSTKLSHFFLIHFHFPDSRIPTVIQDPLTLSWMFWEVSSSAFFSREDTHNFRFWRQREAAARLRSRKRCLRSSGSSSTVRRRRPPVLGVGWAGETCSPGRKRSYVKGTAILSKYNLTLGILVRSGKDPVKRCTRLCNHSKSHHYVP